MEQFNVESDRIDPNKKYILNPAYIMRSDVNRVVFAASGSNSFEKSGEENILTLIHPIHALLFSFFSGRDSLKDVIKEIIIFFHISEKSAYDLVMKFIENEKKVVVEYDNNFFYFPKKVLVECNDEYLLRTYSVDDFNIKGNLDFTSVRLNVPIEMSLLINNRCTTDCIYCYADKRNVHDCSIPYSRIKEIINESKNLGFKSFDIQGGELFLYKYWPQLLNDIFRANFSIYLSTKYPLAEKDIIQLKGLGVKEIQISIDSIFEDDLIKNIRISKGYLDKMLNAIKLLNDNGISIKLKAVVTSKIFNIERIGKYIDYFSQFENIKIVEITAPSFSNYKTQNDFFSYRLSLKQIQQIKALVVAKKSSLHFDLVADVAVEDNSLCHMTFADKKKEWEKRSRCTGNQSSFLILPNGDVTVCEEVYFNKNFILGNILKDSIMDVWNSNQAKALFYISQSIFPRESRCSICREFEDCRHNLGVCWVDVMASYGEKNWLFPAPGCPYAPPPSVVTYCE